MVAGEKHDGARRGGERVAGVKHDTVDESRHNMLCTACARGIGTMWTPKVMATARCDGEVFAWAKLQKRLRKD